MKLYYLIAVEVDKDALLTDNPPESITEAVADEIKSWMDTKSVREALGVVDVVVHPHADRVVRDLRMALAEYAWPKRGWMKTQHADAYEASREVVPDGPGEVEDVITQARPVLDLDKMRMAKAGVVGEGVMALKSITEEE